MRKQVDQSWFIFDVLHYMIRNLLENQEIISINELNINTHHIIFFKKVNHNSNINRDSKIWISALGIHVNHLRSLSDTIGCTVYKWPEYLVHKQVSWKYKTTRLPTTVLTQISFINSTYSLYWLPSLSVKEVTKSYDIQVINFFANLDFSPIFLLYPMCCQDSRAIMFLRPISLFQPHDH